MINTVLQVDLNDVWNWIHKQIMYCILISDGKLIQTIYTNNHQLQTDRFFVYTIYNNKNKIKWKKKKKKKKNNKQK